MWAMRPSGMVGLQDNFVFRRAALAGVPGVTVRIARRKGALGDDRVP